VLLISPRLLSSSAPQCQDLLSLLRSRYLTSWPSHISSETYCSARTETEPLQYLLTLDKPSLGTGSFLDFVFCIPSTYLLCLLLDCAVSLSSQETFLCGAVVGTSTGGAAQKQPLLRVRDRSTFLKASITPRASNVYRGIIHDCSYRTTFETVKSPSGEQGLSINPQ
jgi:hypothetical protein